MKKIVVAIALATVLSGCSVAENRAEPVVTKNDRACISIGSGTFIPTFCN